MSNILLTYSILEALDTLVGVCYEHSLFERISRTTALTLHQEGYAYHVRDRLRQGAMQVRGSTELPVFSNNFQPPAALCCGRHSLQAWGIMRRTPFFKWAASTGMVWLVEYLHAALREVEYRKQEDLPTHYRKAATLLRGYAALLNLPEEPTWFPVPCGERELRAFFALPLQLAEQQGIKVPLDKLRPESAVALGHHLVRRLADDKLVYTGTRPPTWLGAGRQWFCVPMDRNHALYYSKASEAPTWVLPTYWLESAVCAGTLRDLTIGS
jgi:hypothetical protein